MRQNIVHRGLAPLYIEYMHSVRRYRTLTGALSSHDAPLPGVTFTSRDMLQWLDTDNWERVREWQLSGRGEDHGHLRHCCIAVDGADGGHTEGDGAGDPTPAPKGDQRGMAVLDALQLYFAVPPDVGRLLIKFGAVHCSRIPPEIPLALLKGPEEETKHEEVRRRARRLVVEGGELDGLSMSARSRVLMSKTDRVLDEGFVAKPYSYIRAHLWPKRFPLFHAVDWRDRVVAFGDDFVIVNKPSGVPVPPTVDNVLENVQAGAALALGVPVETVHITSRIDQPTEGLVVVGRSKAFVSRFNAAMRSNATKKYYRAAVWVEDGGDGTGGAVGAGVAAIKMLGAASARDVRHRVLIKYKMPGTPYVTLVCDGLEGADAVTDQMVECHMVVRSVVSLGEGEHCLPVPSNGGRLYELEIELVTGRTHQIRCQLSALGLPLVGDDLYRALADQSLRERLLADPEGFLNVLEDGTRVLQEPEIAIGLQAFRLEFDGASDVFQGYGQEGAPIVFEAGTPWWRQNGWRNSDAPV